MRNSRGKLFVYVAVLCVVCFIVFLLSNTHTSLKELEGVNEKCQQQRDSLSAQLQVVYEHKNRLEKSLQQEKTDHRHTKDVHEKENSEAENKLQKEKEERQKLQTQINQLKMRYSELEDEKLQAENDLKQQLKTVQSQKDAEIEKLQNHISELLSEKDKLEVSNNAYVWKIEQHESEINLCHLQLQQTKAEFNTCQEQLSRHNLNTINTKIVEENAVPEKKIVVTVPKAENQSMPLQPQVAPPAVKDKETDKKVENKNHTSAPFREKPVDKPRVMPVNNLGDGVLPKPLDLKPEDLNKEDKDIDAALEITDDEKNKKLPEDNIIDNVIDRNAAKYNLFNNNGIEIHAHKDLQNLSNIPFNGLDNQPQALPPGNFDRADDKDDHAGERGDDGFQYGNPDLKQQVELPEFKRHMDQQKQVIPNPPMENNDIAAQVNDMMNKSPGNVINNAAEQNVLVLPPNNNGLNDNKIHNFKNGRPFMHRGADAHHVLKDNNYEEDDDDRENDDEPVNGIAPLKGNILQDNDFDDQENPDNVDNAKEEEGVMAAPK